MAQDVTKNCKKYVIQKIISPVSYLITEFEEEKCDKNEMKQSDVNWDKNLKKCTDTDQISIGQTVVVKYNEVFHTGKVDNIFKRLRKFIYSVLLVDSGKAIETKKENIYLIESQELKCNMKKEFEILVHGIQPAEFNINHSGPYSHGIFHLRKSNNWTPVAFKFVENLFESIPYIFVKIISCDDNKIIGEIYFTQRSDGVPESLSQTLCNEGFAVFCDLMHCSGHKCGCCSVIEKKIPAKALLSGNKLNENSEEFNTTNKNKMKNYNLSTATDQTVPPGLMSYTLMAYKSCQKQNSSSSVQNKSFQDSDSSSSCNSDDLSRFSVCTFGTLCPSTSCRSLFKEDP